MSAAPIMPQHHRFVKAVVQALRKRCGVESNASLVVAVSGGADSVALLRALRAIAPRRRWHLKLVVGHVQHHLREQAEQDARFVEELASGLKLPFERVDLDADQLHAAGNLEAAAREARYTALAEIARKVNAPFIATAHHGDDQLETMLMRLLRGSSVHGLSGMVWRRHVLPESNVHLIRPMLSVDRAMVEQFLADLNQPWREDHTNADVTRLRARLRHEVLPILRDIEPNIARRSVSLSQHLRDVGSLLDQSVDKIAGDLAITDKPGQFVIDRKRAQQLPSAVLHALVRRTLIQAGAKQDALTDKTMMPIIKATGDNHSEKRTFELRGVTVSIAGQSIRIEGED